MVNFIQSADSNIKINEDMSYLLNDALHVNAVFTASGAVTAGSPVLRVNLPYVGAHAKIKWYNTSSDHAPTDMATIKNTTSSVDGLHNITIQLSKATVASNEYHIEGWIEMQKQEVSIMDKNEVNRLKNLIDIAIDFLKLLSECLGKAVAAVIPWRNVNKK